MLVISKSTDSVYKDRNSILNLELPIPDGIEQLYFDGTSGWIEKTDGVKENINALPDWANECVTIFEEAVGPILPELIL